MADRHCADLCARCLCMGKKVYTSQQAHLITVSVECRFSLREIRVLCAAEGPTIIAIYNRKSTGKWGFII